MDPEILLSAPSLLPAAWATYLARAWWRVRREWARLSMDTKWFYVLVAPPLILAMDLLIWTDKAASALSFRRRNDGRG